MAKAIARKIVRTVAVIVSCKSTRSKHRRTSDPINQWRLQNDNQGNETPPKQNKKSTVKIAGKSVAGRVEVGGSRRSADRRQAVGNDSVKKKGN